MKSNDIIGTGEAAKILQIHPHTLRLWVKKGIVPYRKIGRNLQFNRKELQGFAGMAKGKEKADEKGLAERI